MPMPEPNLTQQAVAVWTVPFLAYFLGIAIRKYGFPGANSPAFWRQCLAGIPVSLLLVTPSLALLKTAIAGGDIGAYLLGLGVIIENGMVLQETLTRQLQERMSSPQPPAAAAGA